MRLLPNVAGINGTEVASGHVLLGIIRLPQATRTDVVLVQCKTRDFPGSVEMEAIRNFQCPPLCKKIVHRYRDRVRLPDVRTV